MRWRHVALGLAGSGLLVVGAWLGWGALEAAAGRRLQAEAEARGLDLRWEGLSLGLGGLRLTGVEVAGAARGFTGAGQVEVLTVRLGFAGGLRPEAVALEGLRARLTPSGAPAAAGRGPGGGPRPVITLRDGVITLAGPVAGTVEVAEARLDGDLTARLRLDLTAPGRLEGAGTLVARAGAAGLEGRLEGAWRLAAEGLAGEATALAGGTGAAAWLAAEGLRGQVRRGSLAVEGRLAEARWQAGVLRLRGGRIAVWQGTVEDAAPAASSAGGALAALAGRLEAVELADLKVEARGLPPARLAAARWAQGGALWARGTLGEGRFDAWADALPPTLVAAELTDLPLDSAWLGRPGAAGRVSGELLIHSPDPLPRGGPLAAHGALALTAGRLSHRLVGPRPVTGLRGAARFDLAAADGAHEVRLLARRGAVVLRALGAYTPDDQGGVIALEAAVDPVDCQAALDALPEGALGPWQGLTAEGRWQPTLQAILPLGRPQAVELKIRGFTGRCRFTGLRAALGPDPDLTIGGAPADRRDVLWLNEPFKLKVRAGVDAGLERFVGPGSGAFVPLNHLPAYVGGAAYLSEEMGFWRGGAISPGLIARAVATNLAAGRAVYGGSTVVQQLTKNLFLDREKTLLRKLQEALIAARITDAVPKARVLELYLNCIELGPNVFGIGPAARYYFGKPASALSPREAIFLAMLKPAPRAGGGHRARGSEPDYPWWRGRVVQLADRLLEAGQISAGQHRQIIEGGPLRWAGGQYLGQRGAGAPGE